MSKDLDSVKGYAKLSKKEIATITSNKRPIVVLKKNDNYNFPESLAPGLHNIGVMLPYSPMHYLLFDEGDIDTYVMTSANTPGEPMMITNKEILNLNGISDYSLIHNRKILNRCDDSVIRFRNDTLSFIRRSRGYTPEPYKINYDVNDLNVLALGPELDVTFAMAKDHMIYPSQHIGNTNKLKTLKFMKEAIENMKRITKINYFDAIACDLHPHFFTTKLAHEFSDEFECDVIGVQHHHAHSIALANDYGIDEMIVIACDGVGYGSDAASWGGEILYTNITDFERLGHLQAHKMPGGDMATKHPIRMLLSIIDDEDLISKYVDYFKYGDTEIKNIDRQLEAGNNVGLTTLESVAYYSKNDIEIPFEIKDNILNTREILREVVRLYQKGENKSDIANATQKTIAKGLSQIAIENADKKGVDVIGATGGVFYNEAITDTCKKYIFIQHKNTCAGDGSVSLGQAIVAKTKLN